MHAAETMFRPTRRTQDLAAELPKMVVMAVRQRAAGMASSQLSLNRLLQGTGNSLNSLR